MAEEGLFFKQVYKFRELLPNTSLSDVNLV